MMSWGALFPGQGSQHVGMGRFLFENFSSVRELFELASDTLSLNFKKLCFDGPEEDLAMTENTQPALLLTSVASFRVLEELTGWNPAAGAGHSVGEYAAVVAAEGLGFTDALRAVRTRGQVMQEAVPPGQGGMLAALGLEEDQIRQVCDKASAVGVVEPANFNAPGQIVISGEKIALDWIQNELKPESLQPPARRLKWIPLKVSAPFHCSLMKPAEEKMATVLGAMEMKNTRWPIVQNITAQPVQDGSQVRENLVRQVSGSVLWTQCIHKLKEMGTTRFIECGSGKVLAGLVKKIDSEHLTTFNMTTLEELKQVEQEIKKG